MELSHRQRQTKPESFRLASTQFCNLAREEIFKIHESKLLPLTGTGGDYLAPFTRYSSTPPPSPGIMFSSAN
jgi:hypothetical protein